MARAALIFVALAFLGVCLADDPTTSLPGVQDLSELVRADRRLRVTNGLRVVTSDHVFPS
jgi:hypothetical protein